MNFMTDDQSNDTLTVAPINACDAEILFCDRRRKILPTGLFGDLLWEVLLQLDYAKRHGMVARCVTHPEPGTIDTMTRAERYIQILIAEGLVSRDDSGGDAILTLTETARHKLFQIFNDPAAPAELACPTEPVAAILTLALA